MRQRIVQTMWLIVLGLLAGCGAEAVSPPDDQGGNDDAGVEDASDQPVEGCATNPELCNGRDDDCDTLTDEGFDLQTDPMNCGRCSNFCRFLNADGLCVAGTCRLGPCREDYYNFNGTEGDGCEAFCDRTTTSENTVELCTDGYDNDCDGAADGMDSDCGCMDEICDGLDNDCDEEIDEGFDLTSDPNNCGSCGFLCGPAWHAATPTCVGGGCNFVCDIGWVNANGWLEDGCEARCTITSTSDADCDNEDDNCDGLLNEGFVSVGCSVGVGGPDCAGETACRLTGSGYAEICDVGRDVPDEDTSCDTYDDDCDGATDEDYRGAPCGTGVCAAFAPCVGGEEVTCVPGPPTLPTDTSCNDEDDDCDGYTDEDWVRTTCGTGACMEIGFCVIGREICTPGIPEAERCDGLDNDCDGLTDEDSICAVGATRPCTVTVPTKTCAGAQTCGAACDWGTCTVTAAPDTVETCNLIDDDCDGTVDEPPAAPATICPPADHGTTGCTGGVCTMASCADGWADVNGSTADGCECAVESPEVPNACGLARNLGTFADSGWDVTVTGKIGSATDVDCYSLSGPDSPDTLADMYHIDITFTSNPGLQFEMQVFRGDCATVSCASTTDTYAWYTDYTTGSGTTRRGENPCRPTNTFNFNLCTDTSSSYYFCVSRSAGRPVTCEEYAVRVTNGVE
jgi:hypothetical protein